LFQTHTLISNHFANSVSGPEKAGVGGSTFLSKLEKGLQEPNFLLVERLSRYYGVRLSVFETYTLDEKRLGHHLNDD
jgi:hypothetical protein